MSCSPPRRILLEHLSRIATINHQEAARVPTVPSRLQLAIGSILGNLNLLVLIVPQQSAKAAALKACGRVADDAASALRRTQAAPLPLDLRRLWSASLFVEYCFDVS